MFATHYAFAADPPIVTDIVADTEVGVLANVPPSTRGSNAICHAPFSKCIKKEDSLLTGASFEPE
jgi:hypothetical protein